MIEALSIFTFFAMGLVVFEGYLGYPPAVWPTRILSRKEQAFVQASAEAFLQGLKEIHASRDVKPTFSSFPNTLG